MKKLYTAIGLSLLLLSLAGCAAAEPEPVESAWVSNTRQEEEAGSSAPLTIPVEQAGDPVGVDFRGIVISGTVRAQMTLTGTEEIVWQAEIDKPGPFAVNAVVEPPAAGTYQLGLAWDGPMTTQYALQWKPGEIEVPTISPLALMSGIGMLIVAIGFVVYVVVSQQVDWKYLGLGALGWIASIVLKLVWGLSTNATVYEALTGALSESVGLPIFYLYTGALTGIFEATLVWLVLRYTSLGQGTTWNRALSFGIGFGAVEALLLGISSVTSVAMALTTPGAFPLEVLEQIAQASNPLWGLAPIAERFFTILVHTLSNVLIFYAVAREQPRWFWLAFAYKTLLDTGAAFGQMTGLDTLAIIWALEAFVALCGAAGWLGIRWIKTRYAEMNQ